MIKFNEPYLAGNELEYIKEVFDNNFFQGNGPFTKKVHSHLEDRFQIPHVLLTHSCTAALEISALLLDIKPGDEVIVPSYTFVSTASAYLRCGANVVFCELDPKTMNLDVDDALSRITSKTRAIVPIHYGGIAADMHRLQQGVDGKDILIIEDAAQGLGSKLDSQWLGGIAPLATISFHETKNIHCGLGGALFINDPQYFDRAENIWERGTNRSKMFKGIVDKYSWVDLGSSFYPAEIQAAFLLAQLESFDQNQAERKKVHEHYQQRLLPLTKEGFFKLPEIGEGREINYHSCLAIFNSESDSDGVRVRLLEQDIHSFIGYVPLHSAPMGLELGNKASDLPVTEEYSKRALRLPFHSNLSEENLDKICDIIENYFRG